MIVQISISDQQYLEQEYTADFKELSGRHLKYTKNGGIEWLKPFPSQFLRALTKIRQKYDVDDTFQAYCKEGVIYLSDREE